MTLRSKVLSGLFWSGGGRLLGQAFTWAITIVVIRLLTPADYGLLALATVFVGFLSLLAEAGLGPALIQARELGELTLRRVFGAVILIDLALFALQVAAAPLIADFFEEDRLVWIIRILALSLLFAIFEVIPASLLTRDLDFKRQSMVHLAAVVCGSLSTLGLALFGYGVWSLVIGSLTTRLFNAVAINVVAPFLMRPVFSLMEMRGLVLFGGQVTATRIMWYLYSQADIFIAGKLLGKELLGIYSVSMHLASLPVQKISGIVNQVAYPAFAQAQHKPETVPMHMLKGIRILSFFSFPVLWGMSSIAPEIVTVLLGPKWEGAAVPLQLLSLVMPISMLSPFLNTAFQGIGHGRVVFLNVLTAFIVMPTAFWIGTNWGTLGLSLAWLIVFPLVFILNLKRMLPLVGLEFSRVLSAVALPALAAAGMYGCVGGARQFLAYAVPEPVLMAALVVVGALGYAAITFAINRDGVREVADLFRKGHTTAEPA
jgi:teichuronic acid exporter